ncbi:LLM class flavin-dependent oxidoreductase [Paenibacillus sp. MMO-177]|uniref:LLM class flavin-dependent oxidoreductase n=1 Tax=Paenibacillus sp. MMO-177 TaxID=3081289 RepID=UPI00301A1064
MNPSSNNRQMALGAFLSSHPTGRHIASWRHPEAEPENVLSFDYYRRLVEIAEEGKFDLFFIADKLCILDQYESSITHTNTVRFEPFTLLSALATTTKYIGLAGTESTTYNEPYHTARKLASLDHLSNGRAGWNVVTSATDEEAYNFGRDTQMIHSLRYERAREYVDIAKRLWDGWEEDAIVRDKKSGIYADESKVHYLEHTGKHFNVRGPLNVSRPPQGHPVIIQAGSSEDGKQLAAEIADVVFVTPVHLEQGKRLYAELKERAAKLGKEPDQIKVIPGVYVTVAATEAEVSDKERVLRELIEPKLGLDFLAWGLSLDLSSYPLDGPLPDLPALDSRNGSKSGLIGILEVARTENLTIRQFYERYAKAQLSFEITGTPEQVADELEKWFVEGAADGFMIVAPVMPSGLEDFVRLVVPELQRRGLFREEYTGSTLREHLGLNRPANFYSVKGETILG